MISFIHIRSFIGNNLICHEARSCHRPEKENESESPVHDLYRPRPYLKFHGEQGGEDDGKEGGVEGSEQRHHVLELRDTDGNHAREKYLVPHRRAVQEERSGAHSNHINTVTNIVVHRAWWAEAVLVKRSRRIETRAK